MDLNKTAKEAWLRLHQGLQTAKEAWLRLHQGLRKIIAGGILVGIGVWLLFGAYSPGYSITKWPTPVKSFMKGIQQERSPKQFYRRPQVSFFRVITGVTIVIVGGLVIVKGKQEYFDGP